MKLKEMKDGNEMKDNKEQRENNLKRLEKRIHEHRNFSNGTKKNYYTIYIFYRYELI